MQGVRVEGKDGSKLIVDLGFGCLRSGFGILGGGVWRWAVNTLLPRGRLFPGLRRRNYISSLAKLFDMSLDITMLSHPISQHS